MEGKNGRDLVDVRDNPHFHHAWVDDFARPSESGATDPKKWQLHLKDSHKFGGGSDSRYEVLLLMFYNVLINAAYISIHSGKWQL